MERSLPAAEPHPVDFHVRVKATQSVIKYLLVAGKISLLGDVRIKCKSWLGL